MRIVISFTLSLMLACSSTLLLPQTQFTQLAYAINLPAPKIDVGAYFLIDVATNKIIAQKQAHTKLAPASLVKLMTTYIAFQAIKSGQIKLDDQIEVSKKSWKTGGSRTFIEPGYPLTVKQALTGLIVQSGNDAAVALAEAIAGDVDTFISVMNKEAARIGMSNSKFESVHGLPRKNQYSTAADLATLSIRIIIEFPELYKFHAIKAFTYNDITQNNRNKLLTRLNGVDGLKTGYTKKAGYGIVTSILKNQQRLVAVVLKAKSPKARELATRKLFDYAYTNYELSEITEESLTQNIKVWGGNVDNIDVNIKADPKYILIDKGTKLLRNTQWKQTLIYAPINAGDSLGTLVVTGSDEQIYHYPIVAKETVDQASWSQRLVDRLKSDFLGHNDEYKLPQW